MPALSASPLIHNSKRPHDTPTLPHGAIDGKPRPPSDPAADEPTLKRDRELWLLAGRTGRVDRVLGRALVRFFEENAFRRIGFERRADFVREHLGITDERARWLHNLGKALLRCPEAEAALDDERVSLSHVVVLGRVVDEFTPPEERHAWLNRASKLTVRGLEVAVAAARSQLGRSSDDDDGLSEADSGKTPPDAGDAHQVEAVDDDAPRPGTWVNIPAPARVLELWRLGVDLARKAAGDHMPLYACLESISADFVSRAGEVEDETQRLKAENQLASSASREPAVQASTDGRICAQGSSSPPPRPAPDLTPAERWPWLDWTRTPHLDPAIPRIEYAQDDLELARMVRDLIQIRGRTRLETAELLAEQRDHGGWRRLGFGSFNAYCTERLGLSGRRADKLIRFKQSLDRFKLLRSAYLKGRLGYTSALSLLSILHPRNEAAFVDWASNVSTRELARVVEFAALHRPGITPQELLALPHPEVIEDDAGDDKGAGKSEGPSAIDGPRHAIPEASGEPLARTNAFTASAPTLAAPAPTSITAAPDMDAPAATEALARANAFAISVPSLTTGAPDTEAPAATEALAGANAFTTSPSLATALPEPDLVDRELARLPAGYALPPTEPGGRPRIAGLAPDAVEREPNRIAGRIRVWAPLEIARQFRSAVYRAREILGGDHPDWCYVEVMLVQFIQEQDTPYARRKIEDFQAIARDNFQCQVPVCTSRRNLHPHHLWYRGRGGSDDDWNIVTLCAGHHLRGEHVKTMQVGGWAAGNLFFELGVDRRPRNGSALALYSFHGDRRERPWFVRRALNKWSTWWRVRRLGGTGASLEVPLEPLTEDTLEALGMATSRCQRIGRHEFADALMAAFKGESDSSIEEICATLGRGWELS